jgi:hypothetical protein
MQSNVDDLEDASNELMLVDDDQVLLLRVERIEREIERERERILVVDQLTNEATHRSCSVWERASCRHRCLMQRRR